MKDWRDKIRKRFPDKPQSDWIVALVENIKNADIAMCGVQPLQSAALEAAIKEIKGRSPVAPNNSYDYGREHATEECVDLLRKHFPEGLKKRPDNFNFGEEVKADHISLSDRAGRQKDCQHEPDLGLPGQVRFCAGSDHVTHLPDDVCGIDHPHHMKECVYVFGSTPLSDRAGEIRSLADESWFVIGSTDQFSDLKKDIAHVCHDVTNGCCINEICISDILQTFRKHGYEIYLLPGESEGHPTCKTCDHYIVQYQKCELPNEKCFTDYCSDHTVTSELVCSASFFSAAPLFRTRKQAHDKIPPVFFMDTVAGMSFLPAQYVDISQ